MMNGWSKLSLLAVLSLAACTESRGTGDGITETGNPPVLDPNASRWSSPATRCTSPASRARSRRAASMSRSRISRGATSSSRASRKTARSMSKWTVDRRHLCSARARRRDERGVCAGVPVPRRREGRDRARADVRGARRNHQRTVRRFRRARRSQLRLERRLRPAGGGRELPGLGLSAGRRLHGRAKPRWPTRSSRQSKPRACLSKPTAASRGCPSRAA